MRLLSTLCLLTFAPLGLTAGKPNMVVILADDLGYGDVACLNPNGKIKTPNLDALAAAGMTFTDAHSASGVCSPTRYGLITGRYAWRTGLKNGVLGGLSPRLIEPGRETVASLLKKAGYRTGCVGKWHLGMDWAVKEGKQVTRFNIEPAAQVNNVDYTKPIANGPKAVGFDYYFGISASLDMVPYAFIENDRLTANPTEERNFPMTAGKAGGKTRLGPAAPGFTAEGVLPALVDKATAFIKDSKGPFFLYVPLASPHTPIAPTKEWAGQSGLTPYADFVMQTDAAVGAIRKALADAGRDKDTVVIFASDNGCSPQANYPELAKLGHNPSHVFRGTKADIYEGGHRVPFFVAWPGNDRVRPGSQSETIVCLNDLMRTCCEIGGAAMPDSAGEDSFSFLPILERIMSDRIRSTLVSHSINGSFAIREGDWKLCLCPGSGGWSAPRPGRDDQSKLPKQQLFNLREDVGETKNLEAANPEKVATLLAILDKNVSEGRSTPGAVQKNTEPVDVWKAGREAMKPVVKK